MSQQELLRSFFSLSPEGQRQVIEFIEHVKAQATHAESVAQQAEKVADLAQAPFVGMWKDHPELTDSATWVRNVRRAEW